MMSMYRCEKHGGHGFVSDCEICNVEKMLTERDKRIAELESQLTETIRLSAEKHRPAYDEQQRRIAELEAKLAEYKHTPKAYEIMEADMLQAEAERDNCDELLIHYGFDRGSIPERVDRICAGLVDNTEVVKQLLKERDAAYNRGLERAAEIAECRIDLQSSDSAMNELERCAEAIRKGIKT